MSGITLAGIWMGGALFSFLSMAIAGRELSVELNTFQILFFRRIIGLLISIARRLVPGGLINPLMQPSQVGTRNRVYKYPDHG